ncbi:restriction endonuclease subunit S [Massilia putida]|uniref:restriction endonuclease subunit S n=1 Tax=Massilia putida TaxID=1141883 RepID=UPI000950E809|nr:restriction endonuclease subunit S [Massilia putida]
MSSEWPLVEIEQVCELIVDCVNKTAPVVADVTPYRMIRTTNVRRGRIDLGECRHVEQATYEKWTRRAKLRPGDVVLTREAPIGEVGLVTEADGVFLGQRLMQYRANPRLLDSRFLLYSFLSPFLQQQFGSHEGSGSVVSHIRVGDCFKFKLALPPLRIQREIANLLGALDDRITLLRETNATLEAIAQALFKSWFVDFDPVRAKMEGCAPEGMDEATAALFPDNFEESEFGAVPRGWRVGALGDILKLRNERVQPSELTASLPYVPIENISTKSPFLQEYKSGQEANSSLVLFKKGDVLFGAMRPYFHKVCSAPFDGVTRTTVFTLMPVNPSVAAFALFQAYQDGTVEYATQHSEGSTIPYAKWRNSMELMPITMPPESLQIAYSKVVTSFVERANLNILQAQKLATLRDTLLPRLISGQLRIPEAEAQIEALAA